MRITVAPRLPELEIIVTGDQLEGLVEVLELAGLLQEANTIVDEDSNGEIIAHVVFLDDDEKHAIRPIQLAIAIGQVLSGDKTQGFSDSDRSTIYQAILDDDWSEIDALIASKIVQLATIGSVIF